MEPDDLLALSAADFGAETRRLAIDACGRDDWRGVHDWTKAWISRGGGAWVIDAWLMYVASGLLHGQPRISVRSADLALGTWIESEQDRAVLLWVRGAVIHEKLNDPKTAVTDYGDALKHAPEWLLDRAQQDLARCSADAETSRKRKPSVAPAPVFAPGNRDFVAAAADVPPPGARPMVWDELLRVLYA